MGHARGLDLEGGDAQGALAEGFDVQGRSAEPGLVVERVEAVVETGRPDHPDAPARLLPAQVVAERHEIDEVVRVEMADDHRVEGRRIEGGRQSRERSLTEIEEHARVAESHEVRSTGRAGSIGVCGPRTDHVKVHRRSGRSGVGWSGSAGSSGREDRAWVVSARSS